MKFMITNESSGLVTNCSQNLRYQEEVNPMKKKKKGSSSIKDTCASPFNNPPSRASLYTQRTILTNERKWKVTHAHSPDGGYLATAVSKMVTKILRHYDQDEDKPMVQDIWDTIRPVLMQAFAPEGARDFVEGYWFFLIHEGSNKKRIE